MTAEELKQRTAAIEAFANDDIDLADLEPLTAAELDEAKEVIEALK